ncbi:NADH:flavin oxidoreductase [Robiginitomaculum antarcticum]|uniref:NADH:flavin oxidoreductase n=1 Tax=Robiginitomaculum antarcticum TaxID=437507 RepID=UPI00036E2A6D|nr:NADH:flavin oxidoreductase [Robiginitomaculum antarcticum]
MSNTLFTPFSCRGLDLPNRIVMAPMTRSHSPAGIPGTDVAEYYGRRAGADVGLIVTEGTVVDRPGAGNDPKVPLFYGDALPGWSNVVKSVHAQGGKIAPQLWHTGMAKKPGAGHFPEADADSPSGLTHTGKLVAPVLSESEVADIVASFARSAAHAKDMGMDAIEIHGAHGYLIDEFFWAVMNQRDDKYGGDLKDRATFAAEIISECRKAIGEDMPIILRFSQWKQQDYGARLAETPEALGEFLGVFVDAGVDILHCSQRRYWEPEFEGSTLNLAGWAKKLTGLPTITVGSVGLDGDFFDAFQGKGSGTRGLDDLYERLDAGEFDLVAVGRALLQDPQWASKVKDGKLDALGDYDAASLQTLY